MPNFDSVAIGNQIKDISLINPADIIYKVTVQRHCIIDESSPEAYYEKQFQALIERESLPFQGTYAMFYETHAGTAKLSPGLQEKFDPSHLQWLRGIGLGIFLEEGPVC